MASARGWVSGSVPASVWASVSDWRSARPSDRHSRSTLPSAWASGSGVGVGLGVGDGLAVGVGLGVGRRRRARARRCGRGRRRDGGRGRGVHEGARAAIGRGQRQLGPRDRPGLDRAERMGEQAAVRPLGAGHERAGAGRDGDAVGATELVGAADRVAVRARDECVVRRERDRVERLVGSRDDTLEGRRLSGDGGQLPRPAGQRSALGSPVDEREQQQPGDEHADDHQHDGRRLRTLFLHRKPPDDSGPPDGMGGRFKMLAELTATMLPVAYPTTMAHVIDYIEFAVDDLEQSKAFYAKALGWEFNEYGSDYAGIKDPQDRRGVRRAQPAAGRVARRRGAGADPHRRRRRGAGQRAGGRWPDPARDARLSGRAAVHVRGSLGERPRGLRAVRVAVRTAAMPRQTSEGRRASQSRRPSDHGVTESRPQAKMSPLPGTRPRRPTTHEHLMTDLPNASDDPVANASTPDGETPAGDPELAALVARKARTSPRRPPATPSSRRSSPRKTRPP